MSIRKPHKPENFLSAVNELSSCYVANILRDQPDMLSMASIQVDEINPNTSWNRLKDCLWAADPDDRPVIFGAMVAHVKGRPYTDCSRLMKSALALADFSVRAIQCCPELFLTTKKEGDGNTTNTDKSASNALQILASVDSWEFSYDAMRSAITALKSIGLKDSPNPDWHDVCLHRAAMFSNPDAFRAFVDEFPNEIEIKNKNEETPLHSAARAGAPLNVKLLIDSGADPRPLNCHSRTPLQCVDVSKRMDSAIFLLDTGAYSESDLNNAFNKPLPHEVEKVDRLRAYLASVRARSSIKTAIGSQPEVRPL